MFEVPRIDRLPVSQVVAHVCQGLYAIPFIAMNEIAQLMPQRAKLDILDLLHAQRLQMFVDPQKFPIPVYDLQPLAFDPGKQRGQLGAPVPLGQFLHVTLGKKMQGTGKPAPAIHGLESRGPVGIPAQPTGRIQKVFLSLGNKIRDKILPPSTKLYGKIDCKFLKQPRPVFRDMMLGPDHGIDAPQSRPFQAPKSMNRKFRGRQEEKRHSEINPGPGIGKAPA